MEIGIIGAGNIGTATAADLARKNRVRVYSTKSHLFDKRIKYSDKEAGDLFESELAMVSNKYEDVVDGVDILFIALPTMVIGSTINAIADMVNPNTMVGFIPGAGGVEYLSIPLLKKSIKIFGFERVPYVSRLVEYGKSVSAAKKKAYRVAAMPSSCAEEIAEIISQLFERPTKPMKGFISMTLTPSLHFSRLYDLYKDYTLGEELDDNPLFYGNWRDSSSEICLTLDKELHKVCDCLMRAGVDTSEVVPYPIHYESATPQLLTKKLRSIESLSKIYGPVIEKDDKYYLDITSRYFTESYPYRLCIVKGLADLASVKVPLTTKVIEWYQNLTGKEYIVNGKLEGKDQKECNIPQNYGIDSYQKLIDFYKI